MARPELAAWVKQARAQGYGDQQIADTLRQSGWDELSVRNALAHTTEIPSSPPRDINPAAGRIWRLLGRLAQLAMTLIAFLLLGVAIARYTGLSETHPAGSILYLTGDILLAPLEPARPFLYPSGQLIGDSFLRTDRLLYVPGGQLDIMSLLAFLLYVITFIILSALAKAIYHRRYQ